MGQFTFNGCLWRAPPAKFDWLVAGLLPAIERQQLKKLSPDGDKLLKLVHRWRSGAAQVGRKIMLRRMWPRRPAVAKLVPHRVILGDFSASHHPEGPLPGSGNGGDAAP